MWRDTKIAYTSDIRTIYLQVTLIDYGFRGVHKLNSETEQQLHLPTTNIPHPHYAMKQFDHHTRSEQLEQRVAAKRLRPFLG